MIDPIPLIEKLARDHRLELHEYEALLGNRTPESREYLRSLAEKTRIAVYGREVYIRGLIETTNICKNDCYYCGIRRSNAGCSRYRLTPEDILEAAGEGYTLGFRTFVLQGGEDGWFTDERTTELIRELKHRHPDCAVTLSLGERSYESYRALREAGADRYLLRHETADEEHYAKLHPAELTLIQAVMSVHHRFHGGWAIEGIDGACKNDHVSPDDTIHHLVHVIPLDTAIFPFHILTMVTAQASTNFLIRQGHVANLGIIFPKLLHKRFAKLSCIAM